MPNKRDSLEMRFRLLRRPAEASGLLAMTDFRGILNSYRIGHPGQHNYFNSCVIMGHIHGSNGVYNFDFKL